MEALLDTLLGIAADYTSRVSSSFYGIDDRYPVLETFEAPIELVSRIMGVPRCLVSLAAADRDAVAVENQQQRQHSTINDLTCQVALPD